MLFDASHVASGGVSVSKVMGTTIGPSVFFTGFTRQGVVINGGHEVMLLEGDGMTYNCNPDGESCCNDLQLQSRWRKLL